MFHGDGPNFRPSIIDVYDPERLPGTVVHVPVIGMKQALLIVGDYDITLGTINNTTTAPGWASLNLTGRDDILPILRSLYEMLTLDTEDQTHIRTCPLHGGTCSFSTEEAEHLSLQSMFPGLYNHM